MDKTTIVKEFGKQYNQFLSLNLELKADRDLFERDYSVNDLIGAIHFHLKRPVDTNVPVLLFMYPLSFAEYLLAANKTEAFKALKQYPCPQFVHDKLLALFHPPIESGARIRFQEFGQSNYKSREMGKALRTLEKAMLLKLVYPTTSTVLPAEVNHKKLPKLQFLDIGIVNYVAGLQHHYLTVKDLNTLYRGRIIESVVGQKLLATYQAIYHQLKFWVREKAQSNAEVDYVVPFKEYLIPVEVKSGKTGRLRSLLQYMESTHHGYAVRLYAGEIKIDSLQTSTGKSFKSLNLPYYLVGELEHYLQIMESGNLL
ncbi:MAG: DUF4143 domain-containing protein [Gammaproteobacteria bacterium]|nr:DUF4143 domain-containing protein [Gammaproteobacteria bacterium]